jgi:twitching motility protein PilT
LVAVIAQALLPKIGGGRFAAQEIFINNPAAANLIRENKINQLYSQMQLNQTETGMQTQTQVLIDAVKKGLIAKDTALAFSTKPEELKKAFSEIL